MPVGQALLDDRSEGLGANAFRLPAAASRTLCVLLVWCASAFLSLFVEVDYEGASTGQLLYYTVYNVAVGTFVGFILFDRLLPARAARFTVLLILTVGVGTLTNETLIEPFIFGGSAANFEGIYHGVLDAVTIVVVFLLLRFVMPRSLAPAEAVRGEMVTQRASERPAPPAASAGGGDQIFVRIGDEVRRMATDDIVYLKAERDFTHVICAEATHFVSESLKDMLTKAEPLGFVRVHKSFAVNLRHLDRLTWNEAGLGQLRVPVGRAYRESAARAWRGRRS